MDKHGIISNAITEAFTANNPVVVMHIAHILNAYIDPGAAQDMIVDRLIELEYVK